MPTYEYLCHACGYRFEKFQSIVADPVRTCPACSEAKVKRLLTGGAGLIFKGSGFYITDYKNSKAAAASGASNKKEKTNSSEKPKKDSSKKD